MTVEQIRKLVKQGEDSQTEFLSKIPNGKDLARRIVRIANRGGGKIIIGIGENGNFIGVNSKILTSALEKALSLILGEVNVNQEVHRIDGRKIVVVHISEAFTALGIKEDQGKRRISLSSIPPIDFTASALEEVPEVSSPSEIHNEFSDSNIKPCFGVDVIADAFANLIKKVTTDRKNICVLGVFGEWGRGKTFFLERVKSSIQTSDDADCFDFVTFNAWKYQSTPEIWAHLIQTLKDHKSKIWRLSQWLVSWTSLQSLIEVVMVLVICFLCKDLPSKGLEGVMQGSNTLKIIGISLVAAGATLNLYDLSVKMLNFSKERYSSSKYMGDQHASEKELVRILKNWNRLHMVNEKYYFECRHIPNYPKKNPRKVVLLVEDVDRCEDDKMISVLESLKLILENPDIAKNMIVIISIDADLLKKAIIRKFADIGEKDAEDNAIERMNKLFLAGITLPKISAADMCGYVDSLAELCNANISVKSITQEQVYYSKNNEKEDRSEKSAFDDKDSIESMGEEESLELIKTALKDKLNYGLYDRLTPRQVKILFYRLLLANNLFSKMDENVSKESLAYIIEFSFKFNMNKSLGVNKDNMIRQMVVPYPVGSEEDYSPSHLKRFSS